jgi:hypothetical protein
MDGADRNRGAIRWSDRQMNVRRAQPNETRELKNWIKAHHYLKSTPPSSVCMLEFTELGCRIGAAMIGRPASRNIDAGKILELTRMYFIDDTPANTESRALGMLRKFIRTWFPGIKLLVSYSDPEAGHAGTIYAADNWAPFGRTKRTIGKGWESRNGRRITRREAKQRWVRTP